MYRHLTSISQRPPTCWVLSSQPRWHRSAGCPSLLCHGGYQQRRQLLSLDNERHAVDTLHSRGIDPTKLHPHPTRLIPHGQPQFFVLGPSFQRHIGHVVDRGLYGPGVFQFVPIHHNGGPGPPPPPPPRPLPPLLRSQSRTSPPTWASRTSPTRSPGQKPRK